MKKNLKIHLSLCMAISVCLILSGCEKKDAGGDAAPVVKKIQESSLQESPSPDIIEKCKLFIPPWGEQDWSEWWRQNPDKGEKWFAETPNKMKSVDLSIIPECTHLTNMFVGFAPLKDLKLFAGLTRLKRLDIRYALELTDIGPLANLKNLEYLSIWSTSVSDLSPLVGLDKLREINARMTKITDLTPLTKMKSFERIDLLRTPVKDIRTLAEIPAVTDILLCTTEVEDISPLYLVAERITHLDLCNTPFQDLKALKKFENVKILKLWGKKLGDLGFISGMSKLEELDLSDATFKSLKPLYGLKKLKKLWLLNVRYDPGELKALRRAVPALELVLELD